jgi:hypothetical protein
LLGGAQDWHSFKGRSMRRHDFSQNRRYITEFGPIKTTAIGARGMGTIVQDDAIKYSLPQIDLCN